MEDYKNNDPELNMGAHEPSVDLARNKNLFYKSLCVAGVFVVIILIICTLNYCSNERAKSKVSEADYAMMTAGNDSTAQANVENLYKEAANSNATSAQRAKIFSARYAYDKGNYAEALDYIKAVNTKSPVVQTLKYCMEGDCYINLDKVDDGIDAFKKAVKEADDNPELAPYALNKLANAYRFNKDYKNELEVLRELMKKFPGANPQIESDIARAEAMSK